MLLELDAASLARPQSTPYASPHPLPPSHSHSHLPINPPPPPPTPTLEQTDKFQDIDPQELRRLYLAAMMSLKAEKQQRITK